MNVNEPKLDFSLTEDEQNNTIVLELSVYRHMDTSLMDVDVQPTYARVSVKGKLWFSPGEVSLPLTGQRSSPEAAATSHSAQSQQQRLPSASIRCLYNTSSSSCCSFFNHTGINQVFVSLQSGAEPRVTRYNYKSGALQIFQMVLPAEVRPDGSTALRSQTTGHLVLTMPRVRTVTWPRVRTVKWPPAEGEIKVKKIVSRPIRRSRSQPEDDKRKAAGPERLEVDPGASTALDLGSIVRCQIAGRGSLEAPRAAPPPPAAAHSGFSDVFLDDPDVPPLI
ncbi:hypothetical protein F2P81_000094 [Scophthalmus maximus]|uniref:Dynein axonemal assembly factor 11-like CS domain-containing protein n=1 Tax=Scophthalmus maximus TaxID=52904 RepID=A0A6A4TUV9_SCOMX|nr:hypothetical protein F2P81_000094 [Scophthalmus maximus]